MIQSWENFVTDGQTDKSDFMGRCPANVEGPKTRFWYIDNMNYVFSAETYVPLTSAESREQYYS